MQPSYGQQSSIQVPTAPPEEDLPPPSYCTLFPWVKETRHSPIHDYAFERHFCYDHRHQPHQNKIILSCGCRTVCNEVNVESLRLSDWQHQLENLTLKLNFRQDAMTEDEARKVIVASISKKWWRSCKNAKKMKIEAIDFLTISRYRLATLTEYRWVTNKQEPFYKAGCYIAKSTRITSYTDKWKYKIDIPGDRHTVAIEIPETTEITPCNRCSGKGRTSCEICHRNSRNICQHCHGKGSTQSHEYNCNSDLSCRRVVDVTCYHCGGRGQETCNYCHGSGKRKCNDCSGCGKMKQYSQLHASWNRYYSESYNNTKLVPKELRKNVLSKCKGTRVQSEKCLNEFLIQSQYHLQAHNQKSERGHIVSQKESVFRIPLYRVQGNFKGQQLIYWIAGDERIVYMDS